MEGAPTSQRPSTAASLPRRLSSKRSSRIRLDSASTNDDSRPDMLLSQSMDDVAVKNALGFLEKYDKLEMCDLLASRSAHWILTSSDVYKVLPTVSPVGIERSLLA